ncbi:cellulose biosynthesis cyclic di-GMP-binding regulatory protein BcsB [Solimonas sp. C16B3]|uniref:Cyclic di-GMP-binding protein n=2 Tax=Solimonas marina TaxID=2714601 RepID=A0A969WFD9_9GAMM|nr:cellulose biosynthesis cyclic di-GMP-binding regulatory protein BcsB [Solimonas marina]
MSALLVAASAAAATDVSSTATTPVTVTVTTDRAFAQTARTISFKDLGMIYSMKLRTVYGQASLPLNLRSDQIVTAATLDLHYAHSPSLRFDLSHLSVYLNDQLLKTMPLSAETASGNTVRIPIDPRLLLPHNQLRFELVAHYAKPNECEDPAHSTLWADISNDSKIELSLSPLATVPSLDRLPAPLFDSGDERRLYLPFVFNGAPDNDTVKAAGIVAAWFGGQADYRGANFPVSFGTLPAGYAVLFIDGANAPAGFERYANAREPTISVAENPVAPGAQVLVFSAPNASGLVEAAQALALGRIALHGAQAQISALELPPPRAPWTSSRWVDPSKPFPLADAATGPMSVTGLVPGPISFEFSLPPDLYPLSDKSIQADLKYRAAPIAAVNSSLNVLINDQFAGGVALNRSSKPGAKVDRSSTLDVTLPPEALHAHNRLDAQYHFRRDTNTVCQDFDATSLQGSIDPASTLDIHNYAHFTEMPALEKFADGAFPYSRLADLADTAIVLPSTPNENDISAALIALGHIGRWTRDAASRVVVTTIDALDTVKDRDLLVVGRLDRLALPEGWAQQMPLRLDGTRLQLVPIGWLTAINERYLFDRDVDSARAHASSVIVQAGQDFAALMGFESPLSAHHSVVMLTAGRDGDVRDAALALTDPGESQFIRGGLTLVRGDQVSGYDFGSHYDVGHLPWWFALKRWFSQHPYLIWPLALILVIIVAVLLNAVLRRRAKARLQGK